VRRMAVPVMDDVDVDLDLLLEDAGDFEELFDVAVEGGKCDGPPIAEPTFFQFDKPALSCVPLPTPVSPDSVQAEPDSDGEASDGSPIDDDAKKSPAAPFAFCAPAAAVEGRAYLPPKAAFATMTTTTTTVTMASPVAVKPKAKAKSKSSSRTRRNPPTAEEKEKMDNLRKQRAEIQKIKNRISARKSREAKAAALAEAQAEASGLRDEVARLRLKMQSMAVENNALKAENAFLKQLLRPQQQQRQTGLKRPRHDDSSDNRADLALPLHHDDDCGSGRGADSGMGGGARPASMVLLAFVMWFSVDVSSEPVGVARTNMSPPDVSMADLHHALILEPSQGERYDDGADDSCAWSWFLLCALALAILATWAGFTGTMKGRRWPWTRPSVKRA